MSRSKHQRHHICRNRKCPSPVLGRDSKGEIVWKRRRTIPYGLKRFTGYGGEIYLHNYGEVIIPVIAKNRERKKISIYENFNNI